MQPQKISRNRKRNGKGAEAKEQKQRSRSKGTEAAKEQKQQMSRCSKGAEAAKEQMQQRSNNKNRATEKEKAMATDLTAPTAPAATQAVGSAKDTISCSVL